MKYVLLIFTLIIALAPSAYAKVEKYQLDTTHTQILFSIDHLGFSKSHGKFLDFDGTFDFNRAEPKKSSVNVTVQTASIDMGDKAWNTKMRGPDLFNAKNHPTMLFKSTNIDILDHRTAKITGDLTILEVTKPVILNVTFNKAGVHTFNQKYVAGFSAKTSINRSDFGLTYGRPLIGDAVDIILEVEGLRQNGQIYNN